MDHNEMAIGIEAGQMVETRVGNPDGTFHILSRVVVKMPPPAVETCDGRLPSRLEHEPIPPVVIEGAYIRYLRRMAGAHASDVAPLVGVTSSALSNWENGVARVPDEKWEKLVTLLTVT